MLTISLMMATVRGAVRRHRVIAAFDQRDVALH